MSVRDPIAFIVHSLVAKPKVEVTLHMFLSQYSDKLRLRDRCFRFLRACHRIREVIRNYISKTRTRMAMLTKLFDREFAVMSVHYDQKA